jgi:hypothetical protein
MKTYSMYYRETGARTTQDGTKMECQQGKQLAMEGSTDPPQMDYYSLRMEGVPRLVDAGTNES